MYRKEISQKQKSARICNVSLLCQASQIVGLVTPVESFGIDRCTHLWLFTFRYNSGDCELQRPVLLTWIEFNPTMDK